MKITLNKKLVKAITLTRLREWHVNETSYDWKREITFNLKEMTVEEIQSLKKLLEDFRDIRGTQTIIKDMDTWIDIIESKSPKMKKLTVFEIALQNYLVKAEGHRIFMKHPKDQDVWECYRVTNIKFHEKSEYHHTPAYVELEMVYDKFGLRFGRTITFEIDDILNMTVQEILMRKGIYIETPELRANYLSDVERYRNLIEQIGRQFKVTGIGISDVLDSGDEYRHNTRKQNAVFQLDNKVVVDIFIESDGSHDIKSNRLDLGIWFWGNVKQRIKSEKKNQRIEKSDDDEEYEEATLEIPVHPNLVVFDLQRHMRLSVHVRYMKEWIYDKNLSDKLVLKEELKKLVEMLIQHKDGGFKDIVEGKSGGAVILLTGPAGVGKTLTAEVLAEALEKPLYSVQASQLGITVNELEHQLKLVLQRAARWDAIVLIDEADVYIHERGNDLEQNAIVGVFLRVLEYHKSILLMTTNRPDIVDDAIASRCIARVDYEHPTEIQQVEIWKILAASSGIKLSDDIIKNFTEKHNEFSGRDIKNILKLANLKAINDDSSITFETLDYVKRFNPTMVVKRN